MQARAAEDLKKLVTDKLVAAGLTYEGAKAFATPRRLALTVQGVPVRQPDVKEESKGPKVGAPEQAIAGFLRAAGLTSIDRGQGAGRQEGRLLRRGDREAGPAAIEVIAEIVPEVAKTFPWPKSMRWGAASASPARSTGCGRCIPSWRPSARRPRSPRSCRSRSTASRSGDTTHGHRFMAPARDQGAAASTTMWPSSKRPRSCVDPARRARSS